MKLKGDGIKNENILSNHSCVGDRVKADCNLISLQALTMDGTKPLYQGISDAIGAALAIQHLNDGNGVYISEVDGLNKRCGINYHLELIDTHASTAIAMSQLVDRLEFKTNPDLTPPCGFIGATYSIVSEPTSSLTNLNGFVQVSSFVLSCWVTRFVIIGWMSKSFILRHCIPLLQFRSQAHPRVRTWILQCYIHTLRGQFQTTML